MTLCNQYQYEWRNAYGGISDNHYALIPFFGINSEDRVMEFIIKTSSEHLNVLPAELNSKTKTRELCTVRQVSTYFIRKYRPSISYQRIGFKFKRNHATIINAFKGANDLIFSSKSFRTLCAELEQKFLTLRK